MSQCQREMVLLAKIRRELERLESQSQKLDQKHAYRTVLTFLLALEAA